MGDPYRKLILLILAGLASLWVAPPVNADETADETGGRYALLIGNMNYEELPKLVAPHLDVQRINETLLSLGFKTEILLDGTDADLRQALDRYREHARDADISFLYFSGHGVSSADRENFLVAVDATAPGNANELQTGRGFVPLQEFIDSIGIRNDGRHVAIVDSGRTVPFSSKKSEPFNLRAGKGLAPVRKSAGEIYLFYGSQHGSDGGERNDGSFLANALVEELPKAGDLVRVLGRVRERVYLETQLGQNPDLQIINPSGTPLCLVDCSLATDGRDYAAEIKKERAGVCTGELARPQEGEPRYALVIGNNGYASSSGNWAPLSVPTQDADIMADALEATGFTVRKCVNTPMALLEKEVGAFRDFMKSEVDTWSITDGKVEHQPSGFFYYSGHGTAHYDKTFPSNWIVPTDSTAEEPGDLPLQAVNITQFADELMDIGAKAVFVVIDACRNSLGTKSDEKGAVRERIRSGMLIAYATSENETAKQDSGYAKVLASYLRQPGERAINVFADASSEVARQTNKEQIPEVVASLLDKYYFLPPQ